MTRRRLALCWPLTQTHAPSGVIKPWRPTPFSDLFRKRRGSWVSAAKALCPHCLHCGPGRTTTPKMHRGPKASRGEASGLGQRGCARGVVLLARPASCDARHGYARARRRGDAAAAVAAARAQSRRGTAVAAAAVAAPASGPLPPRPPLPSPRRCFPRRPSRAVRRRPTRVRGFGSSAASRAQQIARVGRRVNSTSLKNTFSQEEGTESKTTL